MSRSSGACRHESCSFDRSVCACGSMHDYCDECGEEMDCPLDNPPQEQANASSAATTEFEKLLASCREIVRKVEVDGLHVASTGNAYGIARELLDSLKEVESRV